MLWYALGSQPLQGMSEDVEAPSAWDASKKMRQNLCDDVYLCPTFVCRLTAVTRSYAILLGASQSVEELGRQASTVTTNVVSACDIDASGGQVPALSAIESSTPAQRLAWMTSLCAATHAKDTLQKLPAGLVLPAVAMRCPGSLDIVQQMILHGISAGTWSLRRIRTPVRPRGSSPG